MKKQVRKILSALLVLTMLLSTLPAAVYAEAGDVEPIATPTAEMIEEPIAEPTATIVPELTEEPAVEPVVEVTAEPTEEPAAMPAAPTELTDAQQAALHALPAGFSAQVVAAAMLSSNSCAHTVFYVQVTWAEETYTRIDDENHRYTGKITQKKLVCGNCGATLQTISVNEAYDEVYGHDWVMDIDSTSPYDFVCSSCGAKKRFTSACSHTNVFQGEDGNLHCSDCGAITYVFEKNECQHKNITIIQPDTVLTWYEQWDANKHVKYTSIWHYDDTSYVDAECDDCGISIICDRNGNNCSYGTTDTAGDYTNEKSTLEAHSFENGVCKYCGESEPEPCAHENTHKEENADKRKYTYLPLSDKPEYHSVSVTKTYNMVCDKCLSIVGDAFTESEQLADEKHTYVDSICTKCGYNNICKHDGEKETETVTTDNYQKLSDGSAHIHKITVTENVYCVDCGALLDSKLISEESTTEPHTEDAACDLCGYMPACKHEAVTYTVKQNRVVKDNGNDATHDVETWEVTIRECADCGTELSRNSECINTEKVKHSFNLFYRSEGYKANLEICSQCGYSRPATKEAVWADANSFIQDSTIDLITRWVMNQNGVLTASESLSKLPSVVGNPYNAIKELFKKKVSDDYYSDVMKSILLDMMREKPSSESDTLIDEKLNKVRNLLTIEKELVDTDEWEAIVKAEGKNSPFAHLGNFIKRCDDLASYAKGAAEVMKACTPYVELLDNVVVNMDFLKGISDSVSKDSELYKASIDLQNELQNELSVFTKCFETATDKIVELGIEKGLEKGMEWLEKNMEIELPLLSALSSADKILRTFPNYYVDLNNIVDAKGNMMNLYILRVDVATELMNASWSDSNVSDSVFDVYSQIVDKEFDAVDTYLKEEQKQQEGFLGWVKEVTGKKNNMTAGEWRKQLEEERKIFHEDYFNALEEAV